jgi:hypothetical protein
VALAESIMHNVQAPIAHRNAFLGQNAVTSVTPFPGLDLRVTAFLARRAAPECKQLARC